MRSTLIICGLLLLAACGGGQGTADPCVLRLDVHDITTNIIVGRIFDVTNDLTVQSGNCSASDANVEWASSAPLTADILAATDSTATVRARQTGSVYVKAWVALAPSVRDSTLLTISVVTETNRVGPR